MEIKPHIFRAYDIRGIYKEDIDEEVFQKIGYFSAKKGEKIFVAHDIRASSKSLALALISGLTTAKAKKIFFGGPSSYGLALFSGLKLKVDKIFFITASHLPPEWNGIKPFWGNAEPFSPEEIKKIGEMVLKTKKKISFQKPKFQRENLKQEYINYLKNKFLLLKNNNLKVVVDCGNGATSLVAPQLFQEMDFQFYPLFCQPDPSFPNRPSEPTFEATKKLRETVLKKKADFGVAFDGDGDRAVIVDDKGNYLGGNEIGIILAKYLLKENKKNKKIIKTVSCSMATEEELIPLGAKIFEVPVGHTFVIQKVKEKKAIIGFEESGHVTIPQYFNYDDAIVVPLKIAEILIREKISLAEIYKNLKKYPYEEKVFTCTEEKKWEIMKNITQELQKKYKRVNTLDGVKVMFNTGWILIRASNTSSKIRLYIEAKNKKNLKALERKFSQFLWRNIQ